ncbi:MAG: tRNA (guanosine(46)-N7)-methyltransferase TrmB [Gammaproteobacteria bacterium]|nr:tRNA (guanosine(46)-N7)-methyltransferase TrmB [Gammaproteobacteria bacterium]
MVFDTKPLRSIRSYVRRESRITPAQVRALKQLWPRYGIAEGATALDWSTVFGRKAPVILEIGFGNGETLAATAAAHPENNYLGVEVHRPGMGTLLRRLETQDLCNVRVMLADASEVLTQRIPDASLSAVHLFSPDPWPKKRHHKRRLVQPDFAALVARKLASGGYLHLATDWPAYAEHMVAVLSRTEGLVDASGTGQFQKLVAERLSTRFEQRGRKLGHEVRDLVYLRGA